MLVLEPLDARIPQWDLSSLAVRHCPICSAVNDAVLKRPDFLSVAYCETCGCWYVTSLPALDDIISKYDGYWHVHRPSDFTSSAASEMLTWADNTGKLNWQVSRLAKLLGGLVGKRILDVGCGKGSFLLSLRSQGADVVGCDLSPEACEFASSMLGINIHQSDFVSCSPIIGKVDAIVMRDFIEHPSDPLACIEAAANILRPGGVLLIDTPNGGEAGESLQTGKEWVGFRVDLEHLQYLSPSTVRWISRKCDFVIEILDVFSFPALYRIDRLPESDIGLIDEVRRFTKWIPGAQRLVRAFRTLLVAGDADIKRDPRLGSYRLFTVLRKGN